MQVSVESGSGLERTIKVQVPTETLQSEVESRLNSMRAKAKIDGFRPGKVPLSVIQKRYGAQIFQEVASDLMQKSFRDALVQEKLRVAGEPVIKSHSLEPGKPLEYTATFEVYPEIKLSPIEKISVEKIEVAIKDADINTMLESLRKQRTRWNPTTKKSRENDKVIINFKGSVDGELFEGGSAEKAPVVIGSGNMIPGFEENLIGLTSGDEKSFTVNFPDDYGVKTLSGKEATFEIVVDSVESPELPEIDEDFVKEFGIKDGDLAKLKADIKNNMEQELNTRIQLDLKAKIMEQILLKNTVEIPESAIAQETSVLLQQLKKQQPDSKQTAEDMKPEALRRVKLGLLLGEIANLSKIQVDKDKIRKKIEELSKGYEDQEGFIRYYYSNPEMMGSVETLVMEESVVDWIVSKADIKTIAKSFDEMMNATPNS